MMKYAKNPILALQNLSQNNPAIKNVMNMVQGRDPKEVFYEECNKRGIDPNSLIDLIK